MKYLFALTFVICFALVTISQAQVQSSAVAGSRCSLTRAQSPELRGIRLGMTSEQLLAEFPEEVNRRSITHAVKTSQEAENYGAAQTYLHPDPQAANPRFAGVKMIQVQLLDERVSMFNVLYVGPEWKTVDQFVAKLTDALRLPRSSWEPVGETRQSLKCDGFTVDAFSHRETAESWARVQDTSAPGVVEDRREIAREKKREAFKP